MVPLGKPGDGLLSEGGGAGNLVLWVLEGANWLRCNSRIKEWGRASLPQVSSPRPGPLTGRPLPALPAGFLLPFPVPHPVLGAGAEAKADRSNKIKLNLPAIQLVSKVPFQQSCTASWNCSWHFTKLLAGKRQIGGRGPRERSGLDFCPGWKTGPQSAIALLGTFPDAAPPSPLGLN